MDKRKTLPADGRAWQQLEQEMDDMAAGDVAWRDGRTPLYVFFADDETYEVGRKAYMKFFTQNALGGKRAFFSLKQMEEEIVDIALSLFRAPTGARGNLTTGGSESIFMACKTARDRARGADKVRAAANIVVPYSAHPAFNKAGEVMDFEVRRVALAGDCRGDVAAMAEAIDEGTFMLAGSAPCFPHGVIDPIDELGALAEKQGLWLHVDACVGGYVAPFVRLNGRPLPAFDFTVAGVRSLSADLHKFGFTPKPASTVFYLSGDDYAYQAFQFDDWPNGAFMTQTLAGTRAGGAVAGAWAVLHHLGVAGYRRIAAELMAMCDEYMDGIEAIDGLALIARPDLTILNFGANQVDIFKIAEGMERRGWLAGLTQRPKGLHLMLSLLHAPVREEYLSDLAEAVGEACAAGGEAASDLKAVY